VTDTHLQTERLLLHRATSADLPVLEGTWLDPRARRFLGGPIDASTLIRRRAELPSEHTFIVTRRADAVSLGACALRPYRGNTELSYVFLPEHWRHGYAYEATSALLRFAFASRPELDRVVAITQTANERSHHLLRKLHMTAIDTYVEWDEPQTLFALTRDALRIQQDKHISGR
jgi:RimJ/RimL family protein N-acetyltransferase